MDYSGILVKILGKEVHSVIPWSFQKGRGVEETTWEC